MTTLVRRWLLVVALMVWQGGFMFYGGVVVPVGADVLGSDREQGFITQRVTDWLNVVGAVALAVWAWEWVAARRWRHGLAWGLMAAALAAQVWLHPQMDALLDGDERRVRDRPALRRLHQAYLAVSTVQWAVALGLTALTLRAWRVEDAPSA